MAERVLVTRVKEAIEKLKEADPEALIVKDAPDHEYRELDYIGFDTAFKMNRVGKDKTLYADYGDDHKLHPDDKRVNVVVIL